MKKLLCLFILCMICCHTLGLSPSVFPGRPIVWSLFHNRPLVGGSQTPKAPIRKPVARIDGKILYFYNVGYDFMVCLFAETGEAVFSTFVTDSNAIVELPTEIEGQYELRLYPGNSSKYFYSEVSIY